MAWAGKPVTHGSYHLLASPLGWIALLGSPHGLRRLALRPTPHEALEALAGGAGRLQGYTPTLDTRLNPDASPFSEVVTCLDRYFHGDAAALSDLALDLSGAPPFFTAAWEACRRIPPRETRSYGWLAAEARRPRAVRAAGQAMARNPLVLVVPCHRVIGGNGSLHGYGAGGLEVKARLLRLEREATAQMLVE